MSGIAPRALTTANPIRWVNDTFPPRLRARWLLMTMRLSMSSLAGIARTLVAVGTPRLDSMLVTTRADAPRSGSTSSSTSGADAGAAAGGDGLGVGVELIRGTGAVVTRAPAAHAPPAPGGGRAPPGPGVPGRGGPGPGRRPPPRRRWTNQPPQPRWPA